MTVGSASPLLRLRPDANNPTLVDYDTAMHDASVAVSREGAELEQYRAELTAYCYRMLGSPFEAVTWKKQRKVRLLAEAFLREAREGLSGASEFRFDVASVTIDRAGQLSLHVFEGAF